jgi:DNA invertase Pin-like site-specific DNA recombinase
MRLIAYIRVSTQDQVDLETQENQVRSINQYCERNGHEVVHYISDLGVSGAVNRPNLEVALTDLENPAIEGLIVAEQSRLSRDLVSGVNIVLKVSELGKYLIFSYDSTVYKPGSSTDQLMGMIKAWGAQEERRNIKMRQTEGIKRYREAHQGNWTTKAIKFTPSQEKKVRALLEIKMPKTMISKILQVSKPVLIRELKRMGIADDPLDGRIENARKMKRRAQTNV